MAVNEKVTPGLDVEAPESLGPSPPKSRAPAICLALYAAGLTALTLAYRLVGDSTAWGEYFTIWPPCLWLFLVVPLALLATGIKEWRRLLAALGMAAIFLVLCGEWRPLLRRTRADDRAKFESLRQAGPRNGEPLALRLATWNINGASGGEPAYLMQLGPYDPDICFFQETPDSDGSFGTETLRGLWSGHSWLDSGDCGTLSRYPMTALETKPVGPWSPPQLIRIGLPNGRALIAANVRLMLPSLILNPLPAANRKSIAFDHAERLGQFPALAGLTLDAANSTGATGSILTGDFNTPGPARSLNPLRKSFRDVWTAVGAGWGATMTADFPVSRIDQCWVSGGITPVAARVGGGAPSDHRFLVVDLIVEGERPRLP